MKSIGIFEAKTRFSEVCEQVAETREPITVTRRGEPLVRIDPIDSEVPTIRERRAAYMATHGKQEEPDVQDFEPAERSQDVSEFNLKD